jgi:hypothetical protein
MIRTRTRTFTTAIASLALLGLIAIGPSAVGSQDPPSPSKEKEKVKEKESDKPTAKEKDDALDRLLDKLDGNKTDEKKDGNEKKDDAKKEADKAEKPAKASAPKPETSAKDKEKTRKPAEVSGKDKALDSLLEKLGESEDKPSPDDRRPPPPGGSPPPDSEKDKDKAKEKSQGQKPEPGSLTGKDKATDEHLEELTGKTRKKKSGEDGEGTGALSKVIKEMREVEERLGKPDTGEDTRKKQQEIVKNLETLIDQMRSSSSQQKMRKTQKQIAGMNPGQQPGQNTDPGTTGGNAPHQKPQKPNSGNRTRPGGKDIWGHLPPELRQDLDNMMTEDFLPRKKDKINRYFLDLTKKSVTRNRGD